MYLTNEQKAVVEYRLKQGYELFGKTVSTLNGLDAYVVNKGKRVQL